MCLCNALTLTKTKTVTSLLMYSSPRFLQKWLQSGKVAGSCHWVEPRQSGWLQRQLQVAAAIYLLPSAKEKLPLPGQTPSSEMKPTLLHHFTPAPRFWRLKGNLFTRRHVPSPRPAGITTTTFVHPLQHPEKRKEGCQNFISPFRASVQTYYAAIPKPTLQGMTAGGRAGLPPQCCRGEVGPCTYTAYGALNKYVELEKSKVLNDF